MAYRKDLERSSAMMLKIKNPFKRDKNKLSKSNQGEVVKRFKKEIIDPFVKEKGGGKSKDLNKKQLQEKINNLSSATSPLNLEGNDPKKNQKKYKEHPYGVIGDIFPSGRDSTYYEKEYTKQYKKGERTPELMQYYAKQIRKEQNQRKSKLSGGFGNIQYKNK
tara:strand:- start:72 stop:560 length:489 start_codon:yes stop_codon:yes gene_type:complete